MDRGYKNGRDRGATPSDTVMSPRRVREAMGAEPQPEQTVAFDGWKLNLSFSAAHCLPYMGKCERLHGHHYAVHCQVTGRLGDEDVVIDFIAAKKALRDLLAELDHRVLVPTTRGKVVTEVGERDVTMTVVDKRYVFPRADCALLEVPTTTAENLARFLLAKFVDTAALPKSVSEVRLAVDEGYGQGAWATWRRR